MPEARDARATLPRIVPATNPVAATRRLPSLLRVGWTAWSGPAPERLARVLVIGACATLFLSATATMHIVYTLRAPYLLFVAAAVVGAPFVVRGWTRAPVWVRWTALAVVVTYALATALGSQQVLADQRAGSHRQLVYLADLVVGQAVIGLILGLWPRDRHRWELVTALAIGAFVVGAYGLYQWFAQHYALPLADVNNSSGARVRGSQGSGLLGWERIHGTFLEPHSFGAFLVTCLPLGVLVAARATGRARPAAMVGVAAMIAALVLTVTVPAWATLLIATTIGAALYAVARGWTGAAAIAGGAVVVICVSAPLVLARPTVLEHVTNRSAGTLEVTTSFRSDTWRNVGRIWARRPALGYGAGQSSVRLALQSDANSPRAVPRRGLPSAQGLWAASLIDAGILGFETWVLFLGGALVIAGAALVRRPGSFRLACFVALTAAVITGQTGEDRLDLAAWTLIGLALAAAICEPSEQHGARGGQ
jgi:hypothetical protein